jgi:benzil reductase ((S)-benzoin forming)
VSVDLSSPLEAHRVMGTRIDAIDIANVDELLVISNAATLEPIGPVSRKPAEAIVTHLNTNLTSAVLFCAEVVSHFQTTPARKVLANISAGAAHDGVFGWSLYCAAKLGMEAFIRSMALEQAHQPYPFIPVNIDPGVVNTDMHIAAGAASPADFPASARFVERRTRGELTAPAAAATAIIRLLRDPRSGRVATTMHATLRPNPSIERTSSSRLRLLSAAAHVER